MQAYLALVLHAHLPFVRHPEHEHFLEENWLYEAITECYLPLIQVLEGWVRDRIEARLTLSISPTLSAMLADPLLQERYARHLKGLLELADREIHRTYWDKNFQPLSWVYHHRFQSLRDTFDAYQGNLLTAFRSLQAAGQLELITTAATHAVLPLMEDHPPSMRAQILLGRDQHRRCFESDPAGIWLPECAYCPQVEPFLKEAKIRWLILDTHGLLFSRPRPRLGVYAPVLTPGGIAAFGRDKESAIQVWSRDAGYPGDPSYRDFYRDVGFDLDYDYVKPYMPGGARTFTGIKYYAITGPGADKRVYDRKAALDTAGRHAEHFINARLQQAAKFTAIVDRPPIIVAPYDAELFGHWWYEGPEFLDAVVRRIAANHPELRLVTPTDYLREQTTHQVAQPAASTWGEEGYLKVWLNESNQWIYPHLTVAQDRMSRLARQFANAEGLPRLALQQAARELLLAQSSDWPFILRTGTSPDYARKRVKDHLLRFLNLHEQLVSGRIDEARLAEIASLDNLFPHIDTRYWA